MFKTFILPHLNVEIKAKCLDPDRIRAKLEAKNARYVGLDHQIDTYFRVPNGRLKLRQGTIENNLIHYHRPNQNGPKASDVQLYLPSEHHESLREALERALGILVVVDKKRHIYFLENVKFHIDLVAELGSFVEIEAIDRTGTLGEAYLQDQCEYFLLELEIQASDLIAVSYSDLLLQNVS